MDGVRVTNSSTISPPTAHTRVCYQSRPCFSRFCKDRMLCHSITIFSRKKHTASKPPPPGIHFPDLHHDSKLQVSMPSMSALGRWFRGCAFSAGWALEFFFFSEFGWGGEGERWGGFLTPQLAHPQLEQSPGQEQLEQAQGLMIAIGGRVVR